MKIELPDRNIPCKDCPQCGNPVDGAYMHCPLHNRWECLHCATSDATLLRLLTK